MIAAFWNANQRRFVPLTRNEWSRRMGREVTAPEGTRLVKAGLITSAPVDGRDTLIIYELTAKGRDAVTASLTPAPVRLPRIRKEARA